MCINNVTGSIGNACLRITDMIYSVDYFNIVQICIKATADSARACIIITVIVVMRIALIIMKTFDRTGAEWLPVVDTDNHLKGYISRQRLYTLYRKMVHDMSED